MIPFSALLGWKDGIWNRNLVSIQGVLAWPSVVDNPIGKQDIVIHTGYEERCECDDK